MTETVDGGVRMTPISVRLVSLAVYAAALATYITLVGLPKQSWAAVAWLWLATIAWDVRKPVLQHLTFLRDWWMPMALLMIYLYSRGISDDLGFVSVHVTAPIDADRWMFGGTLPTEWLQANLCGVPCERASQPAWYDVALTTVYYSHFFAALSIAAYLWMRDRPEWIRYMRRYLTLTFTALVIYIVYPMAPPWMAAEQGWLAEDVTRITARGWSVIGLDRVDLILHGVGNPVAAMPSLHAGITFLVAGYGIQRLRSPWRWLLALYPLAMCTTLVYYAEHYVVDVLAGALLAGVVLVGCQVWVNGRDRVPTDPAPHI